LVAARHHCHSPREPYTLATPDLDAIVSHHLLSSSVL
jgi:hypothetical protein